MAENIRGIVFCVGFVWLYLGVAAWSDVVANVTAGIVLMGLGSWPYVRPTRMR